jgi:hypothetical protein
MMCPDGRIRILGRRETRGRLAVARLNRWRAKAEGPAGFKK